MKKLLLTIITLSIITITGCYDPDTATVRINLGNIPIAHHEPKSLIDRLLNLFEKDAYAVPADIIKVHVAAYSGESLLASATIDNGDVQLDENDNDYIEFNVPAGKDITILVVGELYIGQGTPYAAYYGYSKVDLAPGEKSNVDVSVFTNTVSHGNDPSWSNLLAFTYHALSESLSWNNIGFKVKYHVYGNASAGLENYVPIYSGYDTSLSNLGTYYGFRIYLEFEPFSLRTSFFQSVLIQD